MAKRKEKDELIEQTPEQMNPRLTVAEDWPLVGAPIPVTSQKRKSRTPPDKLGRQLLQK